MIRQASNREATETTTGPDRRTWSFHPRTATDAELPPGPWDNEPDKIQWVDAATNLDCLMVRAPYGHWCGYVGVPQDHPYYRMGFEHPDVIVHGGLTFSAFCAPGEPIDGVCHIAEPGREPKPWWFGFDCAHDKDISPGLIFLGYHIGSAIYRDEEYVRNQVFSLAVQLAGAGREDHR